VAEEGLDHQMPMPLDVPPPEALRTQFELLEETGHTVPENVRKFWARERPLEIKPVNVEHYTSREKLPPRQNVWVRMTGAVPDAWRALQGWFREGVRFYSGDAAGFQADPALGVAPAPADPAA
jgi:acyl-CoA thioesterase